MSEKTKTKIAEWANKSGKTVEELTQIYNESLARLSKHYPTMADTVKDNRARAMVRSSIIKTLTSKAIPFEWVDLGLAEGFDLAIVLHDTCKEMWEKDPATAVTEIKDPQTGAILRPAYCKADGTHLDYRVVFKSGKKNFNYGRPLPQTSFIRNAFGVGKPKGSELPLQPMKILLSDARAQVNFPQGVPMVSRFNPTATEKVYQCNDSTTTKFEVTELEGGQKPNVIAMIEQVCKEFIVLLGELEEWHGKNKDIPDRVCIVEGDVVDIAFDVTDRSHRLILDDESLGFTDSKGNLQTGVTVWIPKYLTDQIKGIGEGSRVFVIGSSAAGQGWDPKTGKPDPEVVRMMMNGHGVYPRPEMLIPREETKIATETAKVGQ